MKELAQEVTAFPLIHGDKLYTYEEDETTTTWDEDMLYGCLCDSSWEVGLGAGQRRDAEWFGYDCSMRHCPSGDDPVTSVDETDCNDVGTNATRPNYYGEFGNGTTGNLCHVDCSNRGLCDYASGLCHCFTGHYGENCGSMSVLAL